MTSSDIPDSSMDLAARDAVWRWIEGFVLQPHSELRRDGAVCPFVSASIRQGTLVARQYTFDLPLKLDTVVSGLRANVADFSRTSWSGRNRTLHAMLVLLPGLHEQEALLLDDAHAAIKDELVEQEIMMAPMHPRCQTPATRNPHMLAFRSPVPMVAIRNMAFHDIMFLTQKAQWFLRYAKRFGPRYRRSEHLDSLMVEQYRAAVRRFGEPD